jgi:hypothetical protein
LPSQSFYPSSLDFQGISYLHMFIFGQPPMLWNDYIDSSYQTYQDRVTN